MNIDDIDEQLLSHLIIRFSNQFVLFLLKAWKHKAKIFSCLVT